MRAFLSHSSKDKGLVGDAASLLRPGTYELDSETFDTGLINSQVIIAALRRCDLFCLFLSNASVTSSYVDFETMLGIELLASGKLSRFLVICLDDEAFEKAAANVRYFNIVRKCVDADTAARQIQGQLVSAASESTKYAHPFTGRDEELLELEKQVTDHRRPPSRSIFISGNYGSGRRTVAQKFYERRFPQVGRSFPVIQLDAFAGLEELYRKVLAALRPTIRSSEIQTRMKAFDIANSNEKARLVAQLLNSLLSAREAALVLDAGGVLTDSGQFVPEMNQIVGHLEAKPYPPLIVVAPRMIPQKLRRPEDDVSYVAIRSLKWDASERLISALSRDTEIQLSDSQLKELVKLGDGHPFNIYRMIDEISERGVEPFLANPSQFIDWKHRQSSDYVAKVQFTPCAIQILALLKQLPELDFQSLVSALRLDPAEASDELLRLANLHVIESSYGVFCVSPALRVAIERDRRVSLSSKIEMSAMQTLADSLSVRLEEGTAPIALIDAAVLSSLGSGKIITGFAAAFLLPSHYVWLAKRHYDQRHWTESIRFASDALQGAGRISSQGLVAACRFLCLSAARVGDVALFDLGINRLQAAAKDDWARSNIEFLKGFNSRLKGNLPEAEAAFRESYKLSPGNISAAREIAAICLARNNLDEAELFAREAHTHAPTNPYLLDILISVLIRKHGRSVKHSSEINAIFDALEAVGEEGGRSFFTTRKAEFEHLWGDNRQALRLIEDAVARTPHIFEPRRLQAEILLKAGNKIKALEVIRTMEEMVNARDPNERRTNYRLYRQTLANYLVEVERYPEAKEIYDDNSIFTSEEQTTAIKHIEIVQGFKVNRR
jgi:tetratricopeptide (TPR) repeat protein